MALLATHIYYSLTQHSTQARHKTIRTHTLLCKEATIHRTTISEEQQKTDFLMKLSPLLQDGLFQL